MLFNSFTYLVFLPIVVALFWTIPPKFRIGLLLVSSYIFYMTWMPSYGTLILGLTVVNYLFGLAIEHYSKHKKAILWTGLVFNLLCLCFFKYANFVIGSVWQAAGWTHAAIGWPSHLSENSPALNIILPLGISFFTFEFIHYITDVYRGSKPLRNFWNFSLFAAFFPSQIAGPIKRFQDFNAQLHDKIVFDAAKFQDGIYLIFLGLFKKMVLSDNLGTVVNPGFANPAAMGTADAWLAAVGFTFQIYLDFSGYTDIGRGSALLMGYKLPENFNWPFLAASLNDFWRRWHISLSTWLRDYLFIPMGGSRGSAWRTKFNLFVTMALGGLWHGADWHYVVWGLFHGTGLVVTKDWLDLVSRVPALQAMQKTRWWHWCGVAFTFTFLIFACIIFRCETVQKAWDVTCRMFTLAPSGEVVSTFAVSTLPVTLGAYALFLVYSYFPRVQTAIASAPVASTIASWWQRSTPAKVASYAFLGAIILGFSPESVSPFIYFQF